MKTESNNTPVNPKQEINPRLITCQKIGNKCDEIKKLLQNKNSNYGCSAFQVPLLASNVSVLESLRVRMSDKIQRLIALTSGEQDRVGESVIDTFMDLCGYIILYLVECDNAKERRDSVK